MAFLDVGVSGMRRLLICAAVAWLSGTLAVPSWGQDDQSQELAGCDQPCYCQKSISPCDACTNCGDCAECCDSFNARRRIFGFLPSDPLLRSIYQPDLESVLLRRPQIFD